MRAEPGGDVDRAEVAHPGHGRRGDTGDQARTTCVDRRDDPRSGIGQQHGHAVGDAYDEHGVGAAGHQRVALRPVRGGSVLHDVDTVAVDLAHVGEDRSRCEVLGDQAEVGLAHLGVVRPLEREVELGEGHGTGPAVPVGEGQVDGAAP